MKNSGVRLNILFSSENKVSFVQKQQGKSAVKRPSQYCLKRSYWKHKQNEVFTRQLYELSGQKTCFANNNYDNHIDYKDKHHNLVYLQYRVKGGPPNIKPLPHGNSIKNSSAQKRVRRSG